MTDAAITSILAIQTSPSASLELDYSGPVGQKTVCIKARTKGLVESSRIFHFKICDKSQLASKQSVINFISPIGEADQVISKVDYSAFFNNPSPYCPTLTFRLTSDKSGNDHDASSGLQHITLDPTSEEITISSKLQASPVEYTLYLEATREGTKAYQEIKVVFQLQGETPINFAPQFLTPLEDLKVVVSQ